MKKTLLLPLAACLLLASGCGTKQETANSGTPTESVAPAKTGTASTTPSEPKEVVQLFLDSMRAGNGARLSSLLSSLARDEIKRKQLEIAPLGSPNAVFNVGEAAAQDEGMLVSSSWTEPEQAGQPATKLEVVWELRKEPEGWRICGMAVDPMNGDEVQIVDFERLEPEAPQDTQRVASLPNTPANLPPMNPAPNNFAPNNFEPKGNVPQNNFPQNSPPAANQQNYFPPTNHMPPTSYSGQAPAGNYPPVGSQPTVNFPNQQANGGLPQQSGNQAPLPPIVPGNSAGGFALPPAANGQPASYDPNTIRR